MNPIVCNGDRDVHPVCHGEDTLLIDTSDLDATNQVLLERLSAILRKQLNEYHQAVAMQLEQSHLRLEEVLGEGRARGDSQLGPGAAGARSAPNRTSARRRMNKVGSGAEADLDDIMGPKLSEGRNSGSPSRSFSPRQSDHKAATSRNGPCFSSVLSDGMGSTSGHTTRDTRSAARGTARSTPCWDLPDDGEDGRDPDETDAATNDHEDADEHRNHASSQSQNSMGSNRSRALTMREQFDEMVANVYKEARIDPHWPLEDGLTPANCLVSLRRVVQIVVRHRFFDLVSAMMILFNCVLIGIETDYLTTSEHTSEGLDRAQMYLNIWYLSELLMRCVCDGQGFFIGPERYWNMFDAVLLSTVVLEMAFASDATGVGRTMRILRLLRMTRTFRLARTLRYVREFRKMAYAMGSSAPTLFWSLVLLLGLLFCFSAIFTQGISAYLHDMRKAGIDTDDDFHCIQLAKYYGRLGVSIYTLYMSITNGISWGEAVKPLLEMNSEAGGFQGTPFIIVFIAYISVSVFGVINIITSVFVESAMQSAKHSKELMMQEKARDKEMYMSHLQRIFSQMDSDGSGTLSMQELADFVNDDDQDVQFYFEALEINASDARALFKLIDTDNSGVIDYMEFCQGCLSLKGEATAYDVNCLIYENRKMQKWWQQLTLTMEEQDRSMQEQYAVFKALSNRLSTVPTGRLSGGDNTGSVELEPYESERLLGRPSVASGLASGMEAAEGSTRADNSFRPIRPGCSQARRKSNASQFTMASSMGEDHSDDEFENL